MEKEVSIPVAELRINNRKYPLYEGVNTVGRNRQAVVNIANLNISQSHSIIIILGGKHYISDLKSSNGTFVNDLKLIPLKLHPLTNNSTLTFGTISGLFVSDGVFSNEVQQSQTSFATQSFFEKSTQLIDSNATQNLDLHDAPTQEITWSNVKSKAKLPPVPKAVFEEPVNDRLNIQENGSTVKEDHVNHSNVQQNETGVTKEKERNVNDENPANIELVSQSHLEVELVDNEVTIGEARSPILTFYPEVEDNDLSDSVYSGIGVGSEENAEAVVNVSDDDLTDCEEEPFKHVTAEGSVDKQKSSNPIEEPERPSRPVFPDDDLTDCEEENSTKGPEAEATNKATVAVVPSTSSVQQDVKKNNDDDDLTDCEEEPFKHVTAEESVDEQKNGKPIEEPERPSRPVFPDVADDDLTDCEEDKENSTKDSEADVSNKAVVPSTSFVQQDVEKNIDDLTCSEENSNETTLHIQPTNTYSLSKSVQNDDDDDLTDCEDDFKPHSSPSKPPDTAKEDSNDSVKFLIESTSGDVNVNNENSDSDDSGSVIGVPNTTKKSTMVISTQENQPSTADNEQINNSSDEVLASRRSRKSFMVISTQDFTESGSDTQVYDVSTKDYTDCDISIPATQDVTGIDLDETDCIPATQDIQVTGNQRSQSTEESFKLGVTQMMTDDKGGNPSQGLAEVVNLKETVIGKGTERSPNPGPSEDIRSKETDLNDDVDDSFLAPTQKFVIETNKSHEETEFYNGPTQKNTEPFVNKEDDDMFSAPTQKVSCASRNSELMDTDVFTALTQKVVELSTQDQTKKTREAAEFYDGPTQIFSRTIVDKENDDLFCAPTQKVNFCDTDLFMAPTQKVVIETNKSHGETEFYNGPTQKNTEPFMNKEDDDMFSAPTQKVSYSSRNSELNDVDLFTAPTQKVVELSTQDQTKKTEAEVEFYNGPAQIFTRTTVNKEDDDLFCASTQKAYFCDTDLFIAPTQKVVEVSTQCDVCLAPTQKFSETKDETAYHDDFYDVPTQKVDTEALERKYGLADDICSAPTQIVDLGATSKQLSTSPSIQEEEVCTKMTKLEERKKKVFTFKKVPCNLEESLSEIIGITPVKSKTTDGGTSTKSATKTLNNQVKPCKDIQDISENKLNVPRSEPKEQSINQVERDVSLSKSSVVVVRAATEPKILESVETNRPEQHTANNESSINVNSEMNQSIAILEAKFHKTRKAKTVSKIDLSVPQRRPSMELSSVVEDASVASVSVRPKRGRKATKTAENTLEPAKPNTRRAVKKNRLEEEPSSSGKQDKNQETMVAPSRRSRRKPSVCLIENNESAVGSGGSRQNIENLDGVKEVKLHKGRKNKAEFLGQNNESDVNSATSKLTKSTKTQAESSESLVKNNETSKHDRVKKAGPVKGNKTRGESEEKVEQNDPGTSRTTRGYSSKSSVEVTTNSKPSRGKRKKVDSDESENSLAVEHLSPPKRQKLELNQTGLSTPQRGRRQKPKVVFTMMESPQLESLIKTMGGSIVDSIKTCSVLITEHVKRSQKLLCAIGFGIPICSPKWVTDSKKQHDFLDPWDYILTDPEAEDKWQFSLKESLKRSKDKKLLANYIFNIQVTNGADVLKGAIESCGGKCITKIPSAPPDNLYIISSLENKSKYSRVIKKHPHITVIEPEAVFDGVLRQELRFQGHILS